MGSNRFPRSVGGIRRVRRRPERPTVPEQPLPTDRSPVPPVLLGNEPRSEPTARDGAARSTRSHRGGTGRHAPWKLGESPRSSSVRDRADDVGEVHSHLPEEDSDASQVRDTTSCC